MHGTLPGWLLAPRVHGARMPRRLGLDMGVAGWPIFTEPGRLSGRHHSSQAAAKHAGEGCAGRACSCLQAGSPGLVHQVPGVAAHIGLAVAALHQVALVHAHKGGDVDGGTIVLAIEGAPALPCEPAWQPLLSAYLEHQSRHLPGAQILPLALDLTC